MGILNEFLELAQGALELDQRPFSYLTLQISPESHDACWLTELSSASKIHSGWLIPIAVANFFVAIFGGFSDGLEAIPLHFGAEAGPSVTASGGRIDLLK
jgi:hypothetical protein